MKLREPPILIMILAIVMIIVGPSKLPELGKALGKTMHSIRAGMEDEREEALAEKKPQEATITEE